MKNRLTYGLLLVALLLAAIDGAALVRHFFPTIAHQTKIAELSEQTVTGTYYFSADEMPFSSPANEQVRTQNCFAPGIGRIILNDFSFLINRSTQLSRQRLLTGYYSFTIQLSDKHTEGYYLYGLRKLLI